MLNYQRVVQSKSAQKLKNSTNCSVLARLLAAWLPGWEVLGMLFPDHESTASLSGSKPSWMDVEWCPDALHLPKLTTQFENNSIWRASGCFTEIQLLGYLSPNDFLFIGSNTEEQSGDVVANNKIQNRVLRSHKGKCLGGWLQGTHASRTLMNFAATGEKGIISSDGNEAKQIHDDSCISMYFWVFLWFIPNIPITWLRVLSCFFFTQMV